MSKTILDKIFDAKRNRVGTLKQTVDATALVDRARVIRGGSQSHRFKSAVENRNRINIIAEFKKASPSKGNINDNADPASTALSYKNGGATAISVLTEEDFFNGSLEDLRVVRASVDVPILRKDFIFDEFQIYEAAEAGAAAILLIAAMLDDETLAELHRVAEDELGLDALVEVHTIEELERAKQIGAKLIGVNNRDLRTFAVSLDVSRQLIADAPSDALLISESGLRSREDLLELWKLGYSGFLIGETFMRSSDPEIELRRFATEYTDLV